MSATFDRVCVTTPGPKPSEAMGMTVFRAERGRYYAEMPVAPDALTHSDWPTLLRIVATELGDELARLGA